MAEKTTIARPYAQAAFRLAQAHKDLGKWSQMLQAGAAVVRDPAMQALIGNPRVTKRQLVELVVDVAGKRLDEHGRNLVRLLVENRRLACLPEIADLFETYRKEAEHVLDARVVSAFPLNAEQQRRIAAALQTRSGRTVTLHQQVDQSLLGGVVIRAQDKVIDGSVTTQLDELAKALAG